MDPLRIVVRVIFAYGVVLAMLRVSGKRTIKQGEFASFVVALVLGDMFDDVLWAEVPATEFIVGAGTLVLLQVLVGIESFWRGTRLWAEEHRTRAGT
jgi:uncharacterized membrane protein YcaP (DUF421 family)